MSRNDTACLRVSLWLFCVSLYHFPSLYALFVSLWSHFLSLCDCFLAVFCHVVMHFLLFLVVVHYNYIYLSYKSHLNTCQVVYRFLIAITYYSTNQTHSHITTFLFNLCKSRKPHKIPIWHNFVKEEETPNDTLYHKSPPVKPVVVTVPHALFLLDHTRIIRFLFHYVPIELHPFSCHFWLGITISE